MAFGAFTLLEGITAGKKSFAFASRSRCVIKRETAREHRSRRPFARVKKSTQPTTSWTTKTIVRLVARRLMQVFSQATPMTGSPMKARYMKPPYELQKVKLKSFTTRESSYSVAVR